MDRWSGRGQRVEERGDAEMKEVIRGRLRTGCNIETQTVLTASVQSECRVRVKWNEFG